MERRRAHQPSRSAIGRQAEDEALAFLRKQGLRLIERNFRAKVGEIDLVMEDDRGTLVFVEVRYRRTEMFGGALLSIDQRKQARLIACGSLYLAARRIQQPVRFDVIALSHHSNRTELQWIQDAFRAG